MIDVCLILEGTFPYVTGGVSSCVYQLISQTPHLNYAIVHIGATTPLKKQYKYTIPENVHFIKELFLYDFDPSLNKIMNSQSEHSLTEEDMKTLFSFFLEGKIELFADVYYRFFNAEKRKISPLELFFDKHVWKVLTDYYRESFTLLDEASFVDYFYNWRFSLYPIFKTLAYDIPRARVYHSLCTGYAGLLGAVARLKYGAPYALTEHGIYVNERKIEISQADWLHNTDLDLKASETNPFFKNWWIQIFETLGKVAYEYADQITTLYEGNRKKQIDLGANPLKTSIIANGINVEQFIPKEKAETETVKAKEQVHIALVGRVVSIKDIKTFIKAAAYVHKRYPNAKVSVIGPTDEEEHYYEECLQMRQIYGMDDVIDFPGRQDVKKLYADIDIMVLSSISEGQPLTILEAYANSIPVVSTDVGSCRELIHGSSLEDKELGKSGFVVPFGKPDLMGECILKLCESPELRAEMGKVAYKRVVTYYQEETCINNYVKLYRRLALSQ